jgi:hypothetical protein
MAGPSLLKGVFFTESDGVPFVELGTVFRRACDETQADRALKPIFARMGLEGEVPKSHFKELVFRGIRGQNAGKPKAAADGVGFCLCVRELDQETIDRNAQFFRAIASKLECGASLRLVSRHARIALSESASIVVVEKEDGVPRMVLYSLLRSYDILNPRDLVHKSLLKYYKELGAWCGDDMIPNSTSAVANATADVEFPVEFPELTFDAVDGERGEGAAETGEWTNGQGTRRPTSERRPRAAAREIGQMRWSSAGAAWSCPGINWRATIRSCTVFRISSAALESGSLAGGS